MKDLSPSKIIDAYRKNNLDFSEEKIIKYFEQESSVARLLDFYNILEKADNKKALKLKAIMEETIGKKYIEKHGVVPREAMALGLLERMIGQELLNDAEHPELHHVHAAFKVRDSYVIDLDIVEVCCPKIQFIDFLPNLESLRISMAGLKEFKGFRNLTKLEWLNLCSNEITEIQDINLIKNLKILEIDNNPIKRINGIRKLKKLTEIVIYDTFIPESTKEEIYVHIRRTRSRIAKEKIKILQLSEKFKNQGEYDKAIMNYKKAIKLAMNLHPFGGEHHHLLSSKDWYNLAISYLKIQNYNEALHSCMQAIKLNSQDKVAQELRKRLVKLIKNKN